MKEENPMTAITQANDPRLLRLGTLMDEAGCGSQFTELDPFGESHGSWQRTLHSYHAELDRYVLVALTNLEDGDEIAVSAGAEERTNSDDPAVKLRFRRFDVGTVRIDSVDSAHWPPQVQQLIEQGVRMAVDIQPLQLEERQLLAS
jgi:hypothetical protein